MISESAPQGRACDRTLLKAEIQDSKNELDDMVKKQTRQCEYQAKQEEAKEYLRDKKGPSKFCGNTPVHRIQNLAGPSRNSQGSVCPGEAAS